MTTGAPLPQPILYTGKEKRQNVTESREKLGRSRGIRKTRKLSSLLVQEQVVAKHIISFWATI